MTSPETLLHIKGLKTYFFASIGVVRAVDGINLNIGKGESVGLVGESGCGKSTIAFSILRLLSPPGRIVEGEIIFKNRNILELSEAETTRLRGAEIAMIFQDPTTYLNPVKTIGDQIAEAIVIHQELDKKKAKMKAVEMLKRLHIPSPIDVAKSYPHQLSGGMQQRAMIAMAAVCNPAFLIADEPTTALDVTVQMQILNLLKELRKELGMSLLLITHDVGIVADLCDRVYVMYAGKIVESADIFQIYKDPKHPYTQGLLRSALSIDRFEENPAFIPGEVPTPIKLPQGCSFHPRCGFAKETCRTKEPVNLELGRGHLVSCWLYA